MEEEAHEEAQEEAPKDETKIQVEAGYHMVSSYLNLHLFHDLLLAPDVKQLLCVDESFSWGNYHLICLLFCKTL